MVDMGDLKSPGPKGPCGFESHLRYNFNDAPIAQMEEHRISYRVIHWNEWLIMVQVFKSSNLSIITNP